MWHVARHRAFVILIITVALMSAAAGLVCAAAPYDSYLFNFWGDKAPAPQAYIPVGLVDGQSVGTGPFRRPQDMAIGPDMRVYIADSGNSRIIRLSPELEFELEIKSFVNDGQNDSFRNPSGLTVTDEGELYIADTDNGRLVVMDKDGNLIRIIGEPESSDRALIKDDYIYRPLKVEVDPLGRIYVLAANVYEGIFQFDSDGSFHGFIGAPRVKASLADIFWMRIATEEQRAQFQLLLPIEYANMGISTDGMLYAVLRETAVNKNHEIVKKLNPAGSDIMSRFGQLPIIGDIQVSGSDFVADSAFVDVLGRDYGMFSVLDATRGRVFTYDGNGSLLYVFGGIGDLLGRFRNPVALGEIGNKLVVLDNRGLTLFEPTVYAQAIHEAIQNYDGGFYKEAAEMWQKVLDQNPGFEIAYNWIATTAVLEQDYGTALAYYRLGQDRSGYSQVFSKLRQQFVSDYITWIMLGVFALFIFLFVGPRLRISERISRRLGLADNPRILAELSAHLDAMPNGAVPKRKKREFFVRKLIDSVLYSLHVIFHPFDGFWDLKHERRGTFATANVLLALTIFTYVVIRQYTAFPFNYLKVSEISLVSDTIGILVPFLLWVGVNWAFTTLMEGKGTAKEIYIMSAYALTPIIILNLPATLASHMLIEAEGSLLTLVRAISVIWALMLLLLGTMILHEYTMAKTLVTAVLIVCGIAAALFVGLLFTSVIDHISRFVLTIYSELRYRL